MWNKVKKICIRLFDKTLTLILWGAAFVVVYILLSVFVFSTFRIPTDSMSPAIEAGDNVLVFKPTIGARLFNITDALNGERVDVHRTAGFRDIRRNDVLVFNFPHPNHDWSKIEMDVLKYYVKRCVALPGDTLRIINGHFSVDGIYMPLGVEGSQCEIEWSKDNEFEKGIYNCFPFDSIVAWNIKDFGPFYVPRAGDTLSMNRTNYLLYRKLISWEKYGAIVKYRDSTVYLNNEPIEGYRFKENYYFMAGDKGGNSQDSRYWGLLPEEYIVGKVWIVWLSVNPYGNTIRWKRLMKCVK